MAKKKVIQEIAEIGQQLETRKVITDAEIARLDKFNLQEIAFQKDIEIANLKGQLLKKEIELLEFKTVARHQERAKEKEIHLQWLTELKKELGISGQFGFNPNTGEVC
jgi:hypothetical protein